MQRPHTKPGPKRQARARPSSAVIIGLSGISVPPDRLRALQPEKVLELNPFVMPTIAALLRWPRPNSPWKHSVSAVR